MDQSKTQLFATNIFDMSNFTRIPSNIKSLQMLEKFVNCENSLQLILILITHAPVVFRLGLWPGMPLYRTVSDRGLWKKNRTKEVRDHLIVLTLTSPFPYSYPIYLLRPHFFVLLKTFPGPCTSALPQAKLHRQVTSAGHLLTGMHGLPSIKVNLDHSI